MTRGPAVRRCMAMALMAVALGARGAEEVT